MTSMSIRLSKSTVSSFLTCPMMFKNIFDGKKQVQNANMAFGSEMHFNIEQFWKGIVIKDNQVCIPRLDSKDRYMKQSFTNFKKMIKIRWETLKEKGDINKFVPQYIEQKFEGKFTLDDVDINLVGIIDMVDNFGEENDYIVEWKSGRMKDDYKWDIVYYCFLLKLNGINVHKGVVFYPYNGKIQIFTVSESDIENLMGVFRDIIHHIKNNVWYHNPNCFCDSIQWEGENV